MLILIRPFREEKGRISILFANIMALQAGLDNFEPMKVLFK
ncbi:MAG: hypothetical protein PHF31_01075 [Methylobacter sp.]|nr:hypothetical protein [Methylobacter sp.]